MENEISGYDMAYLTPHHNSDEASGSDNTSRRGSARSLGDATAVTSASQRSGISRISENTLRRRINRYQNVPYAYQTGGTGIHWQPGTEPGLDPYNDAGAVETIQPRATRKSDITVVDFSRNDMSMYNLDNNNLAEFLAEPRDPSLPCRWINVNGRSWDVVKLLARHKNIHRLAVEDLMHSDDDSRTKVDWFSDHAHVQLNMQKLYRLGTNGDDNDLETGIEENDVSDDDASSATTMSMDENNAIKTALKKFFARRSSKNRKPPSNKAKGANLTSTMDNDDFFPETKYRTLQRFSSGPNEDRVDFMERHAILLPKNLGILIEQVSIFLHADNTITSFFEDSADVLENAIVHRLSSPETILRKSCDASMIMQAIIDGLVDLAFPVKRAYEDIMGDYELDVLTDPDLNQLSRLYILKSELSILRNAIQPTIGVVKQLRFHRTNLPAMAAMSSAELDGKMASESDNILQAGLDSGEIRSSVRISSMAHIYLGDVWDHCKTITEAYSQMDTAADNMMNHIYNIISRFTQPSRTSFYQTDQSLCSFPPKRKHQAADYGDCILSPVDVPNCK